MTILKSLAVLISLALVTAPLTSARADVTVNTAVSGPVNGDGGTFTVTLTGTINNPAEGGDGIVATSANAITTLTIDGVVGAFANGVNNNAGSTITSINISGSLSGGSAGLSNSGSVGTISNLAGGIIQSSNFGLYAAAGASIGTLTNAGTVQGGPFGMRLFGTTGTATNSGTISGDYGFNSNGTVGSFTNTSTGVVRGIDGWGLYSEFTTGGTFANEAGGLIETTGDGFALVLAGANTIATATNGGTIRSNTWGLENKAPITSLTNSGTISGFKGIQKNNSIGTLTNTATGLISGTGTGAGADGIYTAAPGGALVNAGRITGGRSGLYAYYGIGDVTNQNGGVISGTTGDGVYVEDAAGTITNEAGGLISSANAAGVFVGNYSAAVLQTLSNTGTIEGGAAGVSVSDGTIKKLTNAGAIRYSGTGTGPAVFVGSGGVLGDSTGARGVALASTGSNALLDGTIVNIGTIHHGFTIENQDVTVSAGGGAGTFTNGMLDVVNGDLTFLNGRTLLGADVAVDGGAGTVFNEAVLGFTGARNFDGAFSQSSAGTLSSLISGESTYGSIVIDGAAAFGGKLDLDLVGGFDFAEGQRYDLFTFTSRTGGFTGLSVDGVALSSAGSGSWTYGTLTLQEQWTATSMSIAAVPEPSTYAMALAGIACGGYSMWRRRKRA